MTENAFSKGDAIDFGWKTVTGNFWFWVGLAIILLLVNWIPGAISEGLKHTNPFLSLIVSLGGAVLYMIIALGVIKIALGAYDQKPLGYEELFANADKLWRYFAATILSGLAVLGGFILLIIPGIIVGVRLQFFAYYIVDKNYGIMESIKASWALTKGKVFNLFLFGLLLGLIVILGFLCLFLGIVVALPVTYIAHAYIFRKLTATPDIQGAPVEVKVV